MQTFPENPYSPPGTDLQSATGDGPWFFSLIVASAVGVVSLASLLLCGSLFFDPEEEIFLLSEFVKSIGFLLSIVLIPVWTFLQHKAIRPFVPETEKWSSAFGAFSYFIPIVNFMQPLVTMGEMYNGYSALAAAGKIEAPDLIKPVPLVRRWWGSYLAANLVMVPANILRRVSAVDTQVLTHYIQVFSSFSLFFSGTCLIFLIYRISKHRAGIRQGS